MGAGQVKPKFQVAVFSPPTTTMGAGPVKLSLTYTDQHVEP